MRDLVDEVKKIMQEQFNTQVIEIMPCGNHELCRNLVYKVTVKSSIYVVKVFYKPMKINRELNSIPLFSEYNPLRILANGVINSEDNYEWIIYEYIDGWLLDHIIDDFDLDQLRHIFYQIGEKTARLHSVKSFEYFGDWTKEKQSPLSEYRKFITDECERLIKNIENQELNDKDVLNEAILKLRCEYDKVRTLKIGRLCHRDLDGRNILIKVSLEEGLKVEAFLDFEKCVVFNEYFDIIGFYRRYFIDQPKLIEPFLKGYESVLPIDDAFNRELRFNLYFTGIDICSWSNNVSKEFYNDTIKYLNKLNMLDDHIYEIYSKK